MMNAGLTTRSEIGQFKTDLNERLRAVVLSATSHATVGEAFAVPHTLGTIPSMVTSLPWTNCVVWAEEGDQRLWTEKQVVLRCSVALALLRLVVFE